MKRSAARVEVSPARAVPRRALHRSAMGLGALDVPGRGPALPAQLAPGHDLGGRAASRTCARFSGRSGALSVATSILTGCRFRSTCTRSNSCSSASSSSACAAGILRYVFRSKRVTVDSIFGAVAAYLLVAAIFAVVDMLLLHWDPASFRFPNAEPDAARGRAKRPPVLQSRHDRDARLRRHRSGDAARPDGRRLRGRRRTVLRRGGRGHAGRRASSPRPWKKTCGEPGVFSAEPGTR